MSTILILTFEYPPHRGGIGEYSKQIANGLIDHGYQVHVLAAKGWASQESIDRFDNSQPYPIIRFPRSGPRSLNIGIRTCIFLKSLIKLSPALIFACDKGSASLAYFAKRLLGIPYLVAGHGSEYLQKRHLYQRALNGADKVLLNSHYTFSLLSKNYQVVHNRYKIIPLGGDAERFNPMLPAAPAETDSDINSNHDIYKILTVGRVSDRKGQGLVAQAVGALHQMGYPVQYIMAGDIVDNSKVTEISKKFDDQSFLLFAGEVQDEDLPSFYQNCDLYIQPSRHSTKDSAVEGFGIALCEASLMGKPIIGMKETGMEDVVVEGMNGYLIPQEDHSYLRDTIKFFLDHREKGRELGIQARYYALKNLTWLNTQALTEREVRKTLNAHRSNSEL